MNTTTNQLPNLSVGYNHNASPASLFTIRPNIDGNWQGEIFHFTDSNPFIINFNDEGGLVLETKLLIQIDNTNSEHIWRFDDDASNSIVGILFNGNSPQNTITPKLLDFSTLELTIKSQPPSSPIVTFPFTLYARRAGDTTLYNSHDPSVGVGTGNGSGTGPK